MKIDRKRGYCSVCGRRATTEHDGRRYCVGNTCQLVAAGIITLTEGKRRERNP